MDCTKHVLILDIYIYTHINHAHTHTHSLPAGVTEALLAFVAVVEVVVEEDRFVVELWVAGGGAELALLLTAELAVTPEVPTVFCRGKEVVVG